MSGPLLPIHLHARALFSRYGFGDGSPFEFEALGPEHDDDPPHPDYVRLHENHRRGSRQDLLELLVRRHLVPAIAEHTGETPTLVRVGTHHNQVRDARFRTPQGIEGMPEAWNDIVVEVHPDAILSALDELEARSGT